MWAQKLIRNMLQREKFCFTWNQTRDIQPVACSLCDWPVSSLSIRQSHSFLGNEVKQSLYAMRAQSGRGSLTNYLNPWRYYPAVHHRTHNSSPPARVRSQSNPIHPPTKSAYDPFWSHPPIYALVFRAVSFPRTFTLFIPVPCVPQSLPTSIALTWSA
jgi:hypothetical protein